MPPITPAAAAAPGYEGAPRDVAIPASVRVVVRIVVRGMPGGMPLIRMRGVMNDGRCIGRAKQRRRHQHGRAEREGC